MCLADHIWGFRTLLAIEVQFHGSGALGDFSDDFYEVACPHCSLHVTDRHLRIGVPGVPALGRGRCRPARPLAETSRCPGSRYLPGCIRVIPNGDRRLRTQNAS